jgi:hypothetical protein
MNKGGPTKAAYDKAYESRPDQIKKREERNKARAEMIKAGKAKKGDGKDIDHIKMLDVGGKNKVSNMRAIPAKENRGWRDDHGKVWGDNKSAKK